MQLPQTRGQNALDEYMDFSGTITLGGTAQLLAPQMLTRSYFFFENLSTTALTIDFGPTTATASLTSGSVSSVAVNNAGLGYIVAPQVVFLGGLRTGDYVNAPSNAATATATISGGAVTGIVVNNGGSGYVVAPLVYLYNPPAGFNLGPSALGLGGGAKIPSATSGILIVQNGSYAMENTLCVTSAVSVFGATTAQAFTCKIKVN